MTTTSDADLPIRKFTYVYVPAEPHKPMEERTYEGVCDLGSDRFVDMIKGSLANQSVCDADADILKENMKEHMKKQKMDTNLLDDAMLQKMISLQSIDIFTAVTPQKETNFRGISVYVDDKGISRKLALNDRMSAMVNAAGWAQQQVFYGDAFISRVYDDEMGGFDWARESFMLTECSSDAQWVQHAKKQRERSGKQAPGSMADIMAGNQNPNTQMMDMQQQQMLTDKGIPAELQLVGTDGKTNYTFKETDEDVVLTIDNGGEKLSKKDISVKFASKSLKASVRGAEVLAGEMAHRCDLDCCTWVVTEEGKLEITLPKADEGVKWQSLFGAEVGGS